MRRYATAGMSTFEDLFDRARTGTTTLDHAEYPPVCDEPTGPVSFALGRTGAMIMHVRPGTCASDEFRLRLLFETGACVFSSPADLGHFCTVALAAAFEIAPSEPIGPHHAAAEANDEPVVRATASSHEDLLDELGRLPGRIGAFAFYRTVDSDVARTELTRAAVTTLAFEYSSSTRSTRSCSTLWTISRATAGGSMLARSTTPPASSSRRDSRTSPVTAHASGSRSKPALP